MAEIKLHPRTGEPLRPVYVSPRTGRTFWPVLGGAEDDNSGGDQQQNNGKADDGDGSFPANTPWRDMTAPQQTAYWRHQAQRHEQRARNAPSAEEIAELRQKAERQDALEADMASDLTKAVEDAKKTTRGEIESEYRTRLADTAFRVAISDRNARLPEADRKTEDEISEFVADLNLSRFLNDEGRVDTAKVLARVEQFAPATGTKQQRKGPTVTGHGSGNNEGGSAGVSAGRDLWNQRNPSRAVGAA